MLVHTLQAGDDVLLGEGVRVTMLAVEDDAVLLQITGPETTGVVVVGSVGERAPCQDALTALPSVN